ncbi:hypothetical protein HWV62_13613 [Athelia sp. TMB]|nr:hypothetical protein HWV62_13613 [Athelia sp. TMB]
MSVKDYLVSERIKNGAASFFGINATLAHTKITATCLAYLLHLGSRSSFDDEATFKDLLGECQKLAIYSSPQAFGPTHHVPLTSHHLAVLAFRSFLGEIDTAPIFFHLTESWAIRTGRQYNVQDPWAHTDNGTPVRNLTVTAPGHGVAALLLTDAGDKPATVCLENECAV